MKISELLEGLADMKKMADAHKDTYIHDLIDPMNAPSLGKAIRKIAAGLGLVAKLTIQDQRKQIRIDFVLQIRKGSPSLTSSPPTNPDEYAEWRSRVDKMVNEFTTEVEKAFKEAGGKNMTSDQSMPGRAYGKFYITKETDAGK